MRNTCIELSIYGERLYRLFLDIIKLELDSLSIADINSIQALTLMNIGKNTITIGELTTKGYYTGSNASYNIRKMTASGYVIQAPSPHDKRACYIKLSVKGLELFKNLAGRLNKYTNIFQGTDSENNKLETCIVDLKKINAAWNEILTNSI